MFSNKASTFSPYFSPGREPDGKSLKGTEPKRFLTIGIAPNQIELKITGGLDLGSDLGFSDDSLEFRVSEHERRVARNPSPLRKITL